MKKSVLFSCIAGLGLAAVLLAAGGCTEPEKQPVNPEELTLTLDPDNLTFPNTGGDKTVEVKTANTWSVKVEEGARGWLIVTKTKNSNILGVKALPNAIGNDPEPRVAKIEITAKNNVNETVIKEIEVTQAEPDSPKMTLSAPRYDFELGSETRTLVATCNVPFTVAVEDDVKWLTVKKGTGASDYIVKAITNLDTEKRSAKLVFTMTVSSMDEAGKPVSHDYTEDFEVTQAAFQPDKYYGDEELVKLHSATEGGGIDIVIVGDGFTVYDQEKPVGTTYSKYEQIMRKACEHFLSIHPFDKYKDWFNVWMSTAISNESGYSVSGTTKDTKFAGYWAGTNYVTISSTDIDNGDGTTRLSGKTKVENICRKASLQNGKGSRHQDVTALVVLNLDAWAGTTNSDARIGHGYAVVPCNNPADAEFRQLLIHELNGHGFGFLGDEYTGSGTSTIPSGPPQDPNMETVINNKKTEIKVRQNSADEKAIGVYRWANICVNTNAEGKPNTAAITDVSQTSWKYFHEAAGSVAAGDMQTQYSMVGFYKGGLSFTDGVYSAESGSVMSMDSAVDKFFYFNAPSRWTIVKRIREIGKPAETFTFEDFVKEDKTYLDSNPSRPTDKPQP